MILPLQPINEKLETKLMIVYLQIALKLKPHEIAHKLNVSIEEVKNFIRIFRRWMKLRRRANIRFLGKHKIIKEEHKRYAYQLITSQTIWPLTLTELKSKLVNKYPCLTSIAKSTLSRLLKNDLRMSYTKMSKVNRKVLKAENILQIAKCASLINRLIANNVEVIFIDEFSVNDRTHKQYGWSLIGSKSLFVNRTSQFSYSFMVNLSQRCYYPVYGTNGSF